MRIIDWSSDVCSSDLIGERVAGREIAARHRPRAMPAISRHERRRIGPEFRRMIGAREMIDRTVMLDGKGGVALHRHPVALEIAHRVIAAYRDVRSEEHTSELQSLMRISYAVFCLKKKKKNITHKNSNQQKRDS